jgi:hypothetical protein
MSRAKPSSHTRKRAPLKPSAFAMVGTDGRLIALGSLTGRVQVQGAISVVPTYKALSMADLIDQHALVGVRKAKEALRTSAVVLDLLSRKKLPEPV